MKRTAPPHLADNVSMVSQLLVLAGVIIGALASYLTTAATERARWRRTLDSRWDDRRVDAYASYAKVVKDMISISSRIAAARGIAVSPQPLPPPAENLELLALAGVKRAARMGGSSSTWPPRDRGNCQDLARDSMAAGKVRTGDGNR
jgi:hypothetical protein